MCTTCGCDGATEHAHPEPGESDVPHTHRRPPMPRPSRVLKMELDVLAKNDLLAQVNRAWLAREGVTVLNLIGAPGAGKTALLESTLRRGATGVPMLVIEGDQATALDAERISATGAPVRQINTGAGCHLDATMVAQALHGLSPTRGSVVFVENVGNLVCPALFDLGERAKVVVMSVTEGADKPLKYPHVFRAADLLVLTKCDLAPHVDFDMSECAAYARSINPGLDIVRVSARTGEGIDAWSRWVRMMAGAEFVPSA